MKLNPNRRSSRIFYFFRPILDGIAQVTQKLLEDNFLMEPLNNSFWTTGDGHLKCVGITRNWFVKSEIGLRTFFKNSGFFWFFKQIANLKFQNNKLLGPSRSYALLKLLVHKSTENSDIWTVFRLPWLSEVPSEHC